MNRIESLAKKFEDHISLPWQKHLAPSEKTIFVVYPKEDERRLRAKRELFRQACAKAGHEWYQVDLDHTFPSWMTNQEYAEDYFSFPDDLKQKLESDLTDYVRDVIRATFDKMTEDDVLALFGVGTLFGFTHVSYVLKQLEPMMRGRLVVFFPGTHEKNTYRFLDARDGWGYMAFPITLTEVSYL